MQDSFFTGYLHANANFCEFYEFGRDVEKENKEITDAKSKLEDLFKKN